MSSAWARRRRHRARLRRERRAWKRASEIGGERWGLEVGKHLVGGGAATVAHDQDGIVFLGREPFLALPRAFTDAWPTSRFDRLADFRMKVSSASTSR